MGVKAAAETFAINQVINYLAKNPEENMGKIMAAMDKFAGDGPNSLKHQRDMIHEYVIDNPDSNWHQLVVNILRNVDMDVIKSMFSAFFINGSLQGWKVQQELREKYDCNIPWAILLDPTSACNLHCTGCWAAEYGNKLNLSYDEIDNIIEQGKELGVYIYIYTGGEPLVRKKDLIRLCEKHTDCIFLCFTNGTLIDEKFADDMLRVKNFIPAISLEGFTEATDSRRGNGTYDRVIKAMDLLKSKRLPYGISACYTRANMDSIVSDEFIDMLIEKGAYFIWYFHYMPVGNDATPELLPTPEQREYIYHQIRDNFRKKKAIFAIDFQNDGQFVGGCIAGGRRFLHINSNGDCDPCVFIHYSDSNIREKTLLETLRAPLFKAYHDGQPFNENMLRPCPMLENPEKIQAIIKKTGAHSTDLQSPESIEHLTEKTIPYAKNWVDTADKLWVSSGHTLEKQTVSVAEDAIEEV